MPADHSPPNRKGRRLGKYEIVSHIATGGMGAVYKAVDTKLGREVALKVLPAEVATNPAMVERFHREARAAARLRHENIVALIDDGEENGTHYLVLEFIEGIDLQKYITQKGKVKVEKARKIMIQAARALDHAYQQGIVHRDIKPGNFLLTKKDGYLIVKLTDLGLARRVNEEEFRVTRDGTTVGTIDYISPEQATNSASADIRSDIYSLGCTFYHMLGGVAPFPEGSLPERLMHHLKTEPRHIRELSPDVPEVYNHILRRMLAKNPEDRYQTPRELLEDLENPDRLQVLSATDRLASLEDLANAESVALFQGPKQDPPAQKGSPTRRSPRSAAIKQKAPMKKEEDEEDDFEEEDFAKEKKYVRRGSWLPPWWPWACAFLVLVLIGLFVAQRILEAVAPSAPSNPMEKKAEKSKSP